MLKSENEAFCIDITSGSSEAMYYTEAIVKSGYMTNISAYLFTHYRANHINAFKKLASRTLIEKVYLPNAISDKGKNYKYAIERIAREYNIEILYYDFGNVIAFNGCEITVLEPTFVSHSTHEIISLFVSTEKDDFLYLSPSFSEDGFDYSDYIADSEHIIFGSHYPKTEKRFNINTNANLIYGNETVFKTSDIQNAATVLNECGRYTFLLK